MGANSALIFGIIINVAILLVFFRFLMQLAAVNFYNPVVMSTVKATKIVDMFGRIFPNVAKGRVNLAALVLLVLLYLLKIFGVMYLSGAMPNSPVHLVILTFVTMIQDLIRFCRYLIFATIILSWVVMFTQSRSPKQVGEILFDKLGLKGGKKTATGQYSTSESVLEKIDHPITELILDYRGLSKLKSTYTDGLLKQANSDTHRVHTSYHQALTATGRLSSTDPNLQNIPVREEIGRQIRKAFIAPQGRVLLAADYSQIELRLMAHFSQDEALVDAFNHGQDVHRRTAAEVLGVALEDVTSDQRRQAKAVNFGLLYGMSEFGLTRQLGFSREESRGYIAKYFQRYPGVLDYMERTRQIAREQGFVETILGRRLYTPDIMASNKMIKQAAERAAINAPLQGSAADIIKMAMIAVDQMLPKDQAKMLLQVHDELVFEVDESIADELASELADVMQSVLQISVPLLVEVGKGRNWDEAH